MHPVCIRARGISSTSSSWLATAATALVEVSLLPPLYKEVAKSLAVVDVAAVAVAFQGSSSMDCGGGVAISSRARFRERLEVSEKPQVSSPPVACQFLSSSSDLPTSTGTVIAIMLVYRTKEHGAQDSGARMPQPYSSRSTWKFNIHLEMFRTGQADARI